MLYVNRTSTAEFRDECDIGRDRFLQAQHFPPNGRKRNVLMQFLSKQEVFEQKSKSLEMVRLLHSLPVLGVIFQQYNINGLIGIGSSAFHTNNF